MRHLRRTLPLLIALTGATFTVACTPTQTEPDPAPALTVNRTGGMCPDGPCNSTSSIRDREWTRPDGTTRKLTATEHAQFVDAATHTRLTRPLPPFTGTCPTAYDGPETTYTLTLDTGETYTVSTCEHVIPDRDPLVVWFNQLTNGT